MSTPYNLLGAHQAEKYVFKRFNCLSHTALHIYAGIRFLEEEQRGFCCQVFADYRAIARVSHVTKNAVRDGLLCLMEAGLVNAEIGSPVKDDKRATMLTRVCVDDLKRNSPDQEGIAQRLADALKRMPFMFKGKTVTPLWSVARTGRVCSAKPNIQGLKEPVRVEGLCEGLPVGHTLEHADIKSADPTVIKHVLNMPQDADLYTCYMHAAECDRKAAKIKVNMLAYVRDSPAVFQYWPEAARNDPVLSEYVMKLQEYKTNLFCQAQKTRSVTTLTGRPIAAETGERLHAGRVFNWRIQGTIADIVNDAALELIDRPEVKTVVPLHDALYVVRTGGEEGAVETALLTQAQKLGIQIQVATECKRPPESCAASAKP